MNKYSQSFLSLCSVAVLFNFAESALANPHTLGSGISVSSKTESKFITAHTDHKFLQGNKQNTGNRSVMQRLRDLIKGNGGEGGTQGEFCSITPNPTVQSLERHSVLDLYFYGKELSIAL